MGCGGNDTGLELLFNSAYARVKAMRVPRLSAVCWISICLEKDACALLTPVIMHRHISCLRSAAVHALRLFGEANLCPEL